jgi:nucleotide-binding universal stress UspA family protein
VTGIVVGVDGSDGSRRALAWALDHAQAYGVDEVLCVHAYDPPLAWIDVGSEYADAMIEHAAKQGAAGLDAALADLAVPSGVRVECAVQEGAASDVLVELSRDADLLVVGSRGRGGFAGLLLGSVSQRCAERAWCPVVIVPAREDQRSRNRPPEMTGSTF